MDKQNFLDANYSEHKPPLHRKHAQCLLQKRIRDDSGTRYFINAYIYAFQLFHDGDKYCTEVQFKKNNLTYNIEIMHFESVEELEQLFAQMWEMMGFDYYEKQQ